MNEYVIHAKVKNNLILGRIHQLGYRTVSEFADACDLNQSQIGCLINMKVPATTSEGAWTTPAWRLADALGVLPEDLFTEEQRLARLASNEAYIELSRRQALEMADPLELLENAEVVETLISRAKLTRREHTLLRLRFFDDLTLAESGQRLDVTGSTARIIEAKALRKLRRATAETDPYGWSGSVRADYIQKQSATVKPSASKPRASIEIRPPKKKPRTSASRKEKSAWTLVSVLLHPDAPLQMPARGLIEE